MSNTPIISYHYHILLAQVVVVAQAAYDSNQEAIEDPSIGTLKAYYKTWGLKEGASGIDFEPIPTRNCTKSEL